METIKPNIKMIKRIAWALSLASGKHCLDVPGEYIWAYPGSTEKRTLNSTMSDKGLKVFSVVGTVLKIENF